MKTILTISYAPPGEEAPSMILRLDNPNLSTGLASLPRRALRHMLIDLDEFSQLVEAALSQSQD